MGPFHSKTRTPRVEQRPVSRARERPEDGNVGAAWHEQADVDAVEGRRTQRLHVGRQAGEIGIAEPERVARGGRDQLVHPQQPPARGLAGHDAHCHVAGREGEHGQRLQGDEEMCVVGDPHDARLAQHAVHHAVLGRQGRGVGDGRLPGCLRGCRKQRTNINVKA